MQGSNGRKKEEKQHNPTLFALKNALQGGPTLPKFQKDLKQVLNANRYGKNVLYRDQVRSTNAIAARWAESGAPEGTVVIAEFQTEGKGRLNRSWDAEAEQNILVSVVIRPGEGFAHPGWIPLVAGVAVADAVTPFVPESNVELKWPNDVLLDGKKVAGILSEMGSAEGARFVILGIGLNVNQQDFPLEFEESATSIRNVCGSDVFRPELLARMLEALEIRIERLFSAGPEAVLPAYLDYLAGIGNPVRLYTASGKSHAGTLMGVDPNGGLQLETEAGLTSFYAGDVTFSPPEA